MWNDEFELPDGSYFVSDIQDYIEYMKHWQQFLLFMFILKDLIIG